MKQFKYGIFQFTKFEFDNKIPIYIFIFWECCYYNCYEREKKRHTL